MIYDHHLKTSFLLTNVIILILVQSSYENLDARIINVIYKDIYYY